MNTKIPHVIIDCDPGADDFFALIWALGLHKRWTIKILAITTTGGNVWAETTYKNALRACEFMDVLDVPVGKSDVVVESSDASHIHGIDGLGNASKHLPRVKIPKISLSSDELLEKYLKKDHTAQVLTFGPLTNIARLLENNAVEPSRIISMGGAVRVPGNVTPVAEFNISYDPEAADQVFTNIHHSVLLPLDVTNQLIFTRNEMNTIIAPLRKGDKNDLKRAKFLEELTLHTFETNMAFRETAGIEWFLVHDASVIAMLIYPHLFHGQFLPIRVEKKGEFTRGQVVTDLRNVAQPSMHTFVVTDVDRDRFMEAMVQDFLSFL
jgi:inosine-uridine nucleoside N-ribohydrolase